MSSISPGPEELICLASDRGPALLINRAGAGSDGTMDEFFLLDDSSYWWNQMPNAYELNRFLMVPNAEHTQVTGIFLKKKN